MQKQQQPMTAAMDVMMAPTAADEMDAVAGPQLEHVRALQLQLEQLLGQQPLSHGWHR